MRGKAIRWCLLVAVAAFLTVPSVALAAGPTVLTVPWDPCPTPACTTPANTPHTTYAVTSTTEITIIMGATVPSAVGSGDSFMVNWHFGDGSADTTFALANPYDISTTHQYPASAGVGTIWTAVVTVTDTTNSTSGSANYFVIQESNDCTKLSAQNQPVCVASRANVAIDWGLWYMHRTMWRVNAGGIGPGNPPVNWGGWDGQGGSPGCNLVNGQAWDCGPYGVANAENVQAFEVNGHLQGGPAGDPYTDDVMRGLNRMVNFIQKTSAPTSASDRSDIFGLTAVTYSYNPATQNFTCNDGSVPVTTDPTCSTHGGQHFYNAGATSCTSPPCTIPYDGNANGFMAYSGDGSGETSYTTSPFLDALVASGTPSVTATNGPYSGTSFKDIVQDIVDFYGFSQYGGDCDVQNGNTRGNGGSCAGGAWLYGPQQGDDDSTSQWAAIGFISGLRGFGVSIPPAITDFNNVWITNAQDLTDPAPVGPDPTATGHNEGAYGYRGSFAFSDAWGAFAVTPSAMVQMSLDGVGRTKNKTFGDASTDFDQRWNTTETFYADNFCNNVAPYNQAISAPRAYMYGMFSFTKSMLEHNEGGSLSPIQYLRTLTPSVFSGNANVPPNTIDWYAALSSASGGTDACDGVAQTLINFQQNPVDGTFDGHWFGNTFDSGHGAQSDYETAWALIMLKGTVFVQCVNNLSGRGAPGVGGTLPRIDLSWSNQANATSYIVKRSSTNGGPYTQVGTTQTTSFSDKTAGLVNGNTYYYVVQPEIQTAEVCQSNQATVKIPTRN